MSSWDTNPETPFFCNPHWQLIRCNKWHPGTSEICTPLEMVVGTHFHVQHGTKALPVILLADGEEASWFLLPSLVSLVSGSTVQPENTYSCIFKVTGQVLDTGQIWNTGLVSSSVCVTSWGEGASLALVGHPSSDVIRIKTPYGVDALLNWAASRPIFSDLVG